MILSYILAVSENYGIGIDNKLPWAHLKGDMKWFKDNTKGKPIVMGSSTWASLPFRPLPMRTNVVLTTRGLLADGTTPNPDFAAADYSLGCDPSSAMVRFRHIFENQEVFIIGGAKVYQDFWPYVNRLYITRVPQVVAADTYMRIDDMMAQDTENEYKGWKLTRREQHFDPDTLTFEVWDYR